MTLKALEENRSDNRPQPDSDWKLRIQEGIYNGTVPLDGVLLKRVGYDEAVYRQLREPFLKKVKKGLQVQENERANERTNEDLAIEYLSE